MHDYKNILCCEITKPWGHSSSQLEMDKQVMLVSFSRKWVGCTLLWWRLSVLCLMLKLPLQHPGNADVCHLINDVYAEHNNTIFTLFVYQNRSSLRAQMCACSWKCFAFCSITAALSVWNKASTYSRDARGFSSRCVVWLTPRLVCLFLCWAVAVVLLTNPTTTSLQDLVEQPRYNGEIYLVKKNKLAWSKNCFRQDKVTGCTKAQ